MGIEPTNVGATIRCVNHFATTAIKLAGAVGIEPTLEVLETSVLPLNYAPIDFVWILGITDCAPIEPIGCTQKSNYCFQPYELLG
jgi:hypothetical protein